MNFHTETMPRSLDKVPAGYIAIRTIADSYAIRNNLSGKYILMNDIDLHWAGYMIPETDGHLFEGTMENYLEGF